MSVSSVLSHLDAGRRVSRVHHNLVVVVLRGAAQIELEVEVPGAGEADGLFEFVVVPDRVDGLHHSAGSPRSRDLDSRELARVAVQEATELGGGGRGGGGRIKHIIAIFQCIYIYIYIYI